VAVLVTAEEATAEAAMAAVLALDPAATAEADLTEILADSPGGSALHYDTMRANVSLNLNSST